MSYHLLLWVTILPQLDEKVLVSKGKQNLRTNDSSARGEKMFPNGQLLACIRGERG